MAGNYDPEILKKVHQYELEILKDFIDVCNEHHLLYFGTAGTALGAVRHGGFIPWDDDVDIAMPRDDYEKLIAIFKENYSEKYTVATAEDFDDFCVMNTHICLNNTLFCEKNTGHLNMPKGIFLDIIPYDNVPDDPKVCRHHIRKAWFFSKLLILRSMPFPVLPFKGLKEKIIHSITAFIWFVMNLFKVSHQKLYKKTKSLCVMYNHHDCASERMGFFTGTTPEQEIFLTRDIFPLQEHDFEGINMLFPCNLDNFLTTMYGDYMVLPPEEKRHNHCPDQIKFPGEPVIVNQ